MNFYLNKRPLVRRLHRLFASGQLRFEKRSCLCGKDDAAPLVSYGRHGEMHPVGICRNCGLVYATRYFDAESLDRFYSSDEYRLLYDGADFLAEARARLANGIGETILNLVQLAKPAGSSVVEIGCGAGWNLVTLQRAGYDVRGYEYGKSMIALGHEAGLDIREGSVDEVDGQFDVAIVNHVVEHVPDFDRFVSRLAALVKPDGVLYVGVPNIDVCGPSQFQNAHCYYFSSRTLAHYMARNGFFTDGLFEEEIVGINGLFRQRDGVVPPLNREYETIRKNMSWRRRWSAAMNRAHHIVSYVP